jgi:hypothetical protein
MAAELYPYPTAAIQGTYNNSGQIRLVIKKARLFGASLRLTPSGLSRNIAPGDVFKAHIARNSWLLRRFATQSRDFLAPRWLIVNC